MSGLFGFVVVQAGLAAPPKYSVAGIDSGHSGGDVVTMCGTTGGRDPPFPSYEASVPILMRKVHVREIRSAPPIVLERQRRAPTHARRGVVRPWIKKDAARSPPKAPIPQDHGRTGGHVPCVLVQCNIWSTPHNVMIITERIIPPFPSKQP